MIPIFYIVGLLGSILLAAAISAIAGWKWLRFLKLIAIIYVAGVLVCYGYYRSSAKEAFIDISPDKRYMVVIYRLPNFSMTPGAGSDAPAIAKLYNSSGKLLFQTDVEMLQMAQVDWYDDMVSIGSSHWKYPRKG